MPHDGNRVLEHADHFLGLHYYAPNAILVSHWVFILFCLLLCSLVATIQMTLTGVFFFGSRNHLTKPWSPLGRQKHIKMTCKRGYPWFSLYAFLPSDQEQQHGVPKAKVETVFDPSKPHALQNGPFTCYIFISSPLFYWIKYSFSIQLSWCIII